MRSLLGWLWLERADPIPEIISRSTDVASHKRATPKTSLLSRETCRSFSFLSIFFMSTYYRCPCSRVRYCCWMKKRNSLAFFHCTQNSFCFCSSQNYKKNTRAEKLEFFYTGAVRFFFAPGSAHQAKIGLAGGKAFFMPCHRSVRLSGCYPHKCVCIAATNRDSASARDFQKVLFSTYIHSAAPFFGIARCRDGR